MEAEVRIEKLVYGGEGLARLASPDGRRQAVFVPFTLPGELARVELLPPARGRVAARLVQVIEASPDRIEPRCEYFGRCGGCQLQHTPAARQLELKRDILRETLRRTGGVEWTGAIAAHAAEPWGYRNRIRVQAVPGVGVGYHERDGRRIVPIAHCPIASPALNRGLAALAARPPQRRQEIELAVDNRDAGLESEAPLEFEAAGCRYRVSNGAFFQVNRFLTDALVEAVTGGERGGVALDLFSGVGLFALPLARSFGRVEAVESSPEAAADLKHNAAGMEAIAAANREALDYLQRRAAGGVDLVVADPPRAGLGRELCAALAKLAPGKLHIVSCDPATLGRDLGMLLAAGFRLESLDLFDLFPQTYHIETVAKLRGRGVGEG